jgi:hypothetical protein
MSTNVYNGMDQVYFITTEEPDGPIKIGLSFRPERRMAEMQAHSPVKLKLIGHIPGSYPHEDFLHDRFKKYRLHGEWFSGEILEDVEKLLQSMEVV